MRTPLIATLALGTLALCAPAPAHAEEIVGIATADAGSTTARVTGRCAFTAVLPTTNLEYVDVFYSASAQSDGPAVSTSVICTIRPGSTPASGANGWIGVTLLGPTAATAGSTAVPRTQPHIFVCVTASAAFIDGTTVTTQETCRPLS